MSVERAVRPGQALEWSPQTVAAVAALVVLVWALLDGQAFWPTWPLWVIAALLGLGLAADQLARGQVMRRSVRGWAIRRSAQPVAATAAMVVAVWHLSHASSSWPTWPLWVVAGLLGLGLVAAPMAQLAAGHAARRHGQPLRTYAQPVAAVAALFVLIFGLSVTTFPAWPMGALRTGAVLLGLGLLAGWLADGEAVRRLAQPVAGVAAVLLLARGLSDTPGLTPGWLLWTMALVLGLGLVAGPLGHRSGWPREKFLSERVDQLFRTRSGALNVQASELRRIERDLHDGAQVQLVALSMKLGRAEDRYRNDPETAALLREAREDAAAAIREFERARRGIAPPVLTDRGLEAAVRSLAQRSGSEVTVRGELQRRPQPAAETAAYFVVAESLTNTAKHATGSRVEVRLDQRGGDLFVEVTDFGPGGADPAGGGLTGLLQRVEALDGTFHVTSPAGVGTQVEAVLPCGR
jgi:signal transduction histidine kinase